VFLVSLFGGRGAIALDLLNLSANSEGSSVPYGKNVIVRQDRTTGKKFLSYHPSATEEGSLTFSGLNVSGDLEIVVDTGYKTHVDFKLISGDNYIVLTKGYDELGDTGYWALNDGKDSLHHLEFVDVTTAKLSITVNTATLYYKEQEFIKISLAKPFLTYTDLEVNEINSNDDELYELSINIDNQFEKGKQAGIQQCVANPASCGITSGGGSAIKLTNLSTRATIQGGANDVIAGFIISGTGSQKVVIRGSGLEAGVNPMLTVQKFPSGEAVASNNDWQVQTAPSSAIPAQFATEPTNAALLLTLPAGAYTAIMSSVGAKGLGLIEVNAID